METEAKVDVVVQDFLEAIYDGQKKAEKFGYRVSAVLLKLLSPLDEETAVEAARFVKSTLRRDDSFYFLGNGLFGAILPDTHEAGGEAAGMRLKRFFHHALTRLEKDDAAQISVGVVSIGPDDRIAPERILHLLKRDLELDMECMDQEPDHGAEPERPQAIKTIKPQVAIVSHHADPAIKLKANIDEKCDVWMCSDIESLKETLYSQAISAVVLIYSGPDCEKHDRITKILRSERKLDSIFKVLVYEGSNAGSVCFDDFDIVVANEPVNEIARIVELGARIGWLQAEASKTQKWTGICESVSKATHKLNQPLQVILGKIEIIILDHEEDHPELAERLKEIRKQALKAAEINHKIARLVKI